MTKEEYESLKIGDQFNYIESPHFFSGPWTLLEKGSDHWVASLPDGYLGELHLLNYTAMKLISYTINKCRLELIDDSSAIS